MGDDFTWQDGERTIRFGRGTLASAGELLGVGFSLLTTPRAESSAPELVAAASSVHHVAPGRVDELAGELRARVSGTLLVALGGGRVIDVAKALAAAAGPGTRAAAVPTTLSAAEMTKIHRHAAGVDASTPHVRPAIVINDPAISASQPPAELAASAANSLGHAVEGAVSDRASPVPTLAAREAARLTAEAYGTGDEPDRDALALAALLAGYTIDQSGYGLHHVLCQTLVRLAGAGHGPANAAMLPHSLVALRDRGLDALDVAPLAERLAGLAGARRLRDIGVDESVLDDCAQAAARTCRAEAHTAGRRAAGDPRPVPSRRGDARHPHRADVAACRGAAPTPRRATSSAARRRCRCAAAASRTSRRRPPRESACASGSAAAGASRPRATSARRRGGAPSRGRWPSPRRSPRRREGPLTPVRARRAGTGPRRTRSTRSTCRSTRSSTSCSRPTSALRTADERLVRSVAATRAWRDRKALASTDGAACTQELVACGAGIAAWATDGSSCRCAPTRSPTAGCSPPAGWEHVLALDLAGHAPRVADEAVELLSAPPCPEGITTVVLDGEQLALQIHESIGHALELDRIQLGEASYAGTSWVSPGDLGSLRYGSDRLTIVADATLPGGAGDVRLGRRGRGRAPLPAHRPAASCAPRCPTASRRPPLGLDESGGCARADGFARQPIVRMTNVSIEPGEAGTARGPDRRHGRGDPASRRTARGRSTTAACSSSSPPRSAARSAAGELGRLLRNPSYAGITPRFWGSLDAVCGPEEWRLWGLTNCGKGEPGQVMSVSHGAAPARFRDVQVGVA